MFDQPSVESKERIAVVIPMYRVEADIQDVISALPEWVDLIVVVDDASPDESAQRVLALADPRVDLVRHAQNRGVGAAMISGLHRALELGATVMVKMDGDNQMPAALLPRAVRPIVEGRADFVKGNRFADTEMIRSMPFLRRIGNLALSFLIKLASGYWNVFDPTNGFFAIDADTFRSLDTHRVHPRYFFESSLLVELNIHRAVVAEFAMPARYAGEISSLSVTRALIEFPGLLLRSFFQRLWLQYFVLDFSVASLFVVMGMLLSIAGTAWGVFAWNRSNRTGIPATTGTVMLAVLPVFLGFQLLLQAIVFDVQNVPRVVRSNYASARQKRFNRVSEGLL